MQLERDPSNPSNPWEYRIGETIHTMSRFVPIGTIQRGVDKIRIHFIPHAILFMKWIFWIYRHSS